MKRPPYWARGLAIGALWAGILYGYAHLFIEPEFRYGAREIAVAVSMSVVGGAVGGILASKFTAKKNIIARVWIIAREVFKMTIEAEP